MGGFVAADVFGYTAFNENDTDIGQRNRGAGAPPRLRVPDGLPLRLPQGHPGFRNPVEHPYEVVHESVRLIRKRSTTRSSRPAWLQDFKDYAFDRRIFGVTQVKAQIKGADEAGAVGGCCGTRRTTTRGGAPARDVAAARPARSSQ
jgi:hypothetical protein